MADKAARKAAEVAAAKQLDLAKAREAAAYNPFGRPGAGAPLRAADGQAVTRYGREER